MNGIRDTIVDSLRTQLHNTPRGRELLAQLFPSQLADLEYVFKQGAANAAQALKGMVTSGG